MHLEEAREHFWNAGRVLVVGTSLTVFPAAGLVEHAHDAAEKVLVDLDATTGPTGFRVLRGSADVLLPTLIGDWCRKG